MMTELLTRLPGLELAGEPEQLRSNFVNGIKHLPVRVRR
jgi:cytochrome P450